MKLEDIPDESNKRLAKKIFLEFSKSTYAVNPQLGEWRDIIQENKWLATIEDDQGETLLHKAASQHSSAGCAMLLQERASLEKANAEGKTALHIAAGNQSPAVLFRLLQQGAFPQARDNTGSTPLHYATSHDSRWLLMMAGADPHARNDAQASPYDLAGNALTQNGINTVILQAKNNATLEFQDCKLNRETLFDQKNNLTEDVLWACTAGVFGQYISGPLLRSGRPEDRALLAETLDALPLAWKGRMTHQNMLLERAMRNTTFDPLSLAAGGVV